MTQSLADVFFARCCVHCGDSTESSGFDFLCKECSKQVFLAKPPCCTICGYPFYGVLAGPRTCPHCVELTPIFDSGKTLFLAKGPARSIIHELKYQRGFYILRDIYKLITESVSYQDYIKNSILVPVPLHPTKLRERGYNQSDIIADLLREASGGASTVEKLLIRHEYTKTQTRLCRELRHQNVKNAFALAADAVVIPTQTYIIVDDVFTTGSTLNACALALHSAGATDLRVVTLGHG